MSDWRNLYDLSKEFNVSPEAIRQRALRGNWRRCKGNDGRTLVIPPTDLVIKQRKTKVRSNEQPIEQSSSNKSLEKLITVLQAHITTLERQVTFMHEQLIAERLASEESLLLVKQLSQELAELKSAASNPVKDLQKKISLELPAIASVSSMSVILKRLELIKAARHAA